MDIVFEDKDKIIVNKPAGQLTQSGKNFDLDLVSEVMNYQKSRKESVYAAVINRLDRPVSGLVLIAKNKQSAGRYTKIMQQQGFCKQYYALVCGKLDEKQGIFVDYLIKGNDNIAKVVKEGCPGAKEAKLEYKVVAEAKIKPQDGEENRTGCEPDGGMCISMVEINLITGRFHQIRAQFASRGHGIVGDVKYNSGVNVSGTGMPDRMSDEVIKEIGLKPREIALCAHSLNVDGKVYDITPEWWQMCLKRCRM